MNKIGDAQEYWIMRDRLNINNYTQAFQLTGQLSVYSSSI